jgi:hypothetical protein
MTDEAIWTPPRRRAVLDLFRSLASAGDGRDRHARRDIASIIDRTSSSDSAVVR